MGGSGDRVFPAISHGIKGREMKRVTYIGKRIWGNRLADVFLHGKKQFAWKGIRGVHSTNEGVQENTLEGRGPALVELELRVSARAWA